MCVGMRIGHRVPEESGYETAVCPIDGTKSDVEFEKATYHLNLLPPLRVVRCQVCGLLYLSPRPAAPERIQMLRGVLPAQFSAYGEHPYRYATVAMAGREKPEERLNRLRRLMQRDPDNGRIAMLDIGCSGGVMLACAEACGWMPIGIDPGSLEITSARKRVRRVLAAPAEFLPFRDCTFDLVYANHVYEHLADPLQAAREALRVLRPGGIVFVEVPNQFDNFSFRRDILFNRVRQRERSVASIHHLWFFSRRSLKRLLAEAGFVHVRTQDVHALARGWRLLLSAASGLLGKMIYGSYILRAWGFRP